MSPQGSAGGQSTSLELYACITPRPHWLVCLVGTIVRCLTALAILQGVFSVTKGVHVEEVSGEHGRCLGMQELPPGRVAVPLGCRGDLQALRTRRIVDAPTWWPSRLDRWRPASSPLTQLGGCHSSSRAVES
jgi:hypothetical protein